MLLLLVSIISLLGVFAHSGRTDSNGGHWDRSTGIYHYHTGEYAGKSSNSSSKKYESTPKSPTYETPVKRESNGDVKEKVVLYDVLITILLYAFPISLLVIPLLVELFKELYYSYFNKRR